MNTDHQEPETVPAGAPPVEALVEWLEALAADPLALKAIPHALRSRLQRATGRLAPFDREERRRLQQERRRADKQRRRKHDDALLNRTSNRAIKRSLRFPVAPPALALEGEHRLLLEQQASTAPPEAPPNAASAGAGSSATERLLEPRACYVCKEDYSLVHEHYDSMCPRCAEINMIKRNQTANLEGRVALVTGARVKIGYETVLKLLRAGSHVVATTRFPRDAARRYAQEHDYSEWRERLEVHGLDLRHTPSTEFFARKMGQELPRLDFLIHNACQTVRRPPQYYTHLIERESDEAIPQRAHPLLTRHLELISERDRAPSAEAGRELQAQVRPATETESLGITHAATLTQLDLLGEQDLTHLFPSGIRDGEDQQLDLRATNSWRMQVEDVPTIELLEVHLVNSIAPFVLTARLKPLMLRVSTRDKHVVNVSAMEGQFGRSLKTTRHPHTNMAKAALNMMTRTSAAEFFADGIHMNSVDTGWVTDEDPFAKAVVKEDNQRFVPPLDSIDGAARVLDPIFTGFLTGSHCWGKFLKDYAPTDW